MALRYGRIKIWYGLLVIVMLELVVYGAFTGISEYCKNALYNQFNIAAADKREVTDVPYASIINKYAGQEGVDSYLVAAVIKAESSFNSRALSKTGALGLMQVMPDTWRLVNAKLKVCEERHSGDCAFQCYYDPDLNIHIGTAYLGQLVRRYNGNLVLAIAAYNAGPKAVDDKGGIPSNAETQDYVVRVITYWYSLTASPAALYMRWIKKCEQARRYVWWITAITLFALAVVIRQMVLRYGWRRWC
ncbi:MAG: slt 1 [Firmicutes bacterium]|nr:slt 1 [Bacillota bacterium]